MSDANILEALDRCSTEGGYKRPSLNDILIFGRVRCLIEKPKVLGTGVEIGNGYFALLDAYALKCLGTDYFRDSYSYDVNGTYFTKGSILIFVDSPKWVGKDVKVYGKNRYHGVNIKKQIATKAEEGISALVFSAPISQGRKRVYPVVPNMMVELRLNDGDVKGTALEDNINAIVIGRKILYSDTIDSIIPYEGVGDYKVIDVDSLPEENTKSSSSKNFINEDGMVDITKIDMNLVYHLEGQERSPYFDAFKDDIEVQSEARNVFVTNTIFDISDLYKGYVDSPSELLKSWFIDRIASNPDKKVSYMGNRTNRKYIDAFLQNAGSNIIPRDMDESVKDDSDNRSLALETLSKEVYVDSHVLYGDFDGAGYLPMMSDSFTFAVNVVGTCTEIGFDTLVNSLNYCNRYLGIDRGLWLFMLLNCPYCLGLIGVGLSVVDCDLLYTSFRLYFSQGNDESYNFAVEEINKKYRSYLLMLDTLNNVTKDNNTYIKISEYRNARVCYSRKALSNIKRDGFVGGSEVLFVLSEMLDDPNLIDKSIALTKELSVSKWYDKVYFDELAKAGVINVLDDYCALERNIEREFLIYEVFEKLGKEETGITDEVITSVIDVFEKDRGFKLEALQKDGIKLCKYRAGVLSGCAGSGKTTTSDCMAEVLKTLDKAHIIYCTPTGKACRRLAEVVHSTVKTIHSQFSVNLGGSSYLQGAYKKKPKANIQGSIYILDEMAMCSTELMYHVARNITDRDIIYFLGDVKQLPPIGGGCPFKVLMKILPCVELGVSKRAAEGSLVNYNTSLINFMSNGVCRELKYDDKSFIAKNCTDESIVSVVRNVFSKFIDGTMNGTKYSEDDIQVITGYQSVEKLSSTSRLNKPIQAYLRGNDRLLFYKGGFRQGSEAEPFYMNDRVIYVNRNSYDICRYTYENGVFSKLITFGCVNGEMGKIVGLLKSTDVKVQDVNLSTISAGEGMYSEVEDDAFKSMLEAYENIESDLRDDSVFCGDRNVFIVLKIYDTDLKKDVYALLRGRSHTNDIGVCVTGGDLDNLNLAYALTCHKMQGSQSPVVIAVFESSGSPHFINRNMINTIITRSQGVVCCVGSVLGEDSMLNRGRRVVSKTDGKDTLSIMSGNTDWLV